MSSLNLSTSSLKIIDNENNVTFTTDYPMVAIRSVVSGSIAIGAPTAYSTVLLTIGGAVVLTGLACKHSFGTSYYVGSVNTYPNLVREKLYVIPYFKMNYLYPDRAPMIPGAAGEWVQGNSVLLAFSPASDAGSGHFSVSVHSWIQQIGTDCWLRIHHETIAGGAWVSGSGVGSLSSVLDSTTNVVSANVNNLWTYTLPAYSGTLQFKLYLVYKI